jgi:hypothetical protein
MPYRMYIRRYAPFAVFGGSYHGDSRSGPSVSLTDTARTIGFITFDRTGITSSGGYSSGTSMVGVGARLGTRYAPVSMTVLSTAPTANGFTASLSTAGANPLAPPGAPDIDTFVDVTFGWGTSTLTAQGQVRGDNFPNAELFLKDTHGRGALLFDFRTGGGQHTGPFTRLFGAHATQILGSFSASIALDAGANFSGSTPAPTPIHGR